MRLLLVGGGHAHLSVLAALRAGRLPGADVTLITSSPLHPYAAMLPALVAGRIPEADCTFDLAALARQAGARFIEARIDHIDVAARAIRLPSGRASDFDYVSIAVGAVPAGLEVPGVREHAHGVRTLERIRALVAALEAAPAGVRVAVVGGGVTGIEAAFAIATRLAGRGRVALLEAGTRLLHERCQAAAEVAMRELGARGIGVALGARVEAVEAGALRTGSGARVPADLVVWAAGATATPLARASGIATDEQGFVIVDGNLRSISHPAVFAAGDAATLSEAPELPRPGPYAARQGPVLAANLSALATGKPVTRFYRPRPDQLLLLSAGPGRAIFVRGRTALAAPWALRLKHFVDRRFVRRIGEHRGH